MQHLTAIPIWVVPSELAVSLRYSAPNAFRAPPLHETVRILAVEGNVPVDVASLAKALVDGRPHPRIYLAFGEFPMPVEMVGGSDVQTVLMDGQVAFVSWFYQVGNLAVNVMYALDGERRDGLQAAWQPRMGAKRIHFETFGE
jgi:hypothetical protein